MAEITTEVMANETPDVEAIEVVDGGNGVVGKIVAGALYAGATYGFYKLLRAGFTTASKLKNKIFNKDEIIEVESYDEEDEVE